MHRRRGWLGILAAGILFLGWATHRRIDPQVLDDLWRDTAPRAARLEGTVTDVPPGDGDGGGNGGRAIVRARELAVEGDGPVREPVRIVLRGPLPGLRPGDRIEAAGLLVPLPPPRNPEEKSARGYIRSSDGIVAELRVAGPRRVRVTGAEWRHRVMEHAARARERIGGAITRGLPEGSEEAGLLKAMVLGAREEATPETVDAFSRSGGMHVFAVSGLHVGIFGSVAWLILRLFGVPRRPAIAVIVVLALGYAYVTGLRPSAVRAAIMLGVFLGGFVIRRQPRLLNSVGVAGLVILAAHPAQLFSVGFQLSFAVMCAIAVWAGPLRRRAAGWLAPDPFVPRSLVPAWRWRVTGTGKYFADLVSVSAAAFAGSWVLLWWYFGTITPVGLIANCALIPMAWLVMGAATVSMGLWAVGLGVLAVPVNWANAALAAALQRVAIFFAAIPGGHFQVPPLEDLRVGAPSPAADLVVFDTGKACGPQVIQGRGPGNQPRTWLIDCGDEIGYRRVIRPWLERRAGRSPDGLILTHGDKAHVGGHEELLREFRVGRVLFSGLPDAAEVSRRWRSPDAGPPRFEAVAAGERMILDEETAVEVVFPPPGFPSQARGDDQCLVLLVSLGPWKVLSLADSGFRTEKWLLEHRPDLRADVVVTGRHGSDPGGLPEFFRAVGCRVVVATSAEFPEGERIPGSTRAFFARSGIRLMDQGRSGAVEMRREGGELVLRGFLGGPEVRLGVGQ